MRLPGPEHKAEIFVQIAAYQDPELIPTLRDCVAKAAHPERLRFGLCWQHGIDDSLEEFSSDPRVRLVSVPWHASRGLGWARSICQRLWRGEPYTLQIDAHHRFNPGWDEQLISFLALTGSDKPMLTAYAGDYTPQNDDVAGLSQTPTRLTGQAFTERGTICLVPVHIPNHEVLDQPVRARFVSGHFYFTLGTHCRECPYDPALFFLGDEICLSIRSFCLGYDLFHPHRQILFHEYDRGRKAKPWNVANDEIATVTKRAAWWQLEHTGLARVRQLLKVDDQGIPLGRYRLRGPRTHGDYQEYAGVDFTNRRLSDATTKGVDPEPWSGRGR